MSQQLPNIEENNQQLLNDIQSLQEMEQQLFNSLETNPNFTSQQQQQIVGKINQISQMRINLYKTLSGVNSYYQNALTTSQGTLQEQSAAIEIVENELNQAKNRLKLIEEEKNNKIRLVEINTYYGDKYAEHASLMKIVIFMLVPVIILALLNKKEILPNSIYYGLICIIAAIGAYFFWMRMSSIIMRDNMNYQEYDWWFNPTDAPTGSSNSSDPWFNSSINLGTCIGQECCSTGQLYDTSSNLCIDISSSAGTSSAGTSSAGSNIMNSISSDSSNIMGSISSDSSNIMGSISSGTSNLVGSASNLVSSAFTESFITESLANQVLTKTNTTNKYKQNNAFSSPPKPNSSERFMNYLKF